MRIYKESMQLQRDGDRREQARALFDPRPAKRERRRHFHAHYWAAYSPKIRRYVGLYRHIGHDHWIWIEADPLISWFTEHPTPIRLRASSRDESHRFDMVLETNGAIECRRLFDIDSLANLSAYDRNSIEMEQAWCESLGYIYRAITNTDLHPYRTFIENWKSMLPYIREANTAFEHRVLGYVSAVEELTVGELLRLLADIDRTWAKGVIYGLLHRGRLVAPELMTSSVSSATNVRISQ